MSMMVLQLRLCLVSLFLFARVASAVSYDEAERPFGGKSDAHERHLQECNVVLANWTVDELTANLDAGIDAALGEGSAQANIAKATLLQSLQYGVQIRRLCAGCSDFPPDTQPDAYEDFCGGYGSDVDFSGLLIVPLDADGSIVNGTHPGAIYCHGTSTQTVPSIEFFGADSGFEIFINAAVASTGSITMMPDYMGYGVSSGTVFKAYLVKQQYHTSIIPLWLMADRVVQQASGCTAALADAVAVLGYSEGGYAAVAVAEGLYNMGFEIIKVEAGAGPYRMGNAVLQEGLRFIDEGIYPLQVREYLALLGAAYSSTYPELANFQEGQDMLASDVRDTLVVLVTNSSSKDLINAQIPTDDPLSVFSPQLVTFTQMANLDGDTDPCNNPDRVIEGVNDLLCEALQDNDLTEILETTPYPVRLCHSPDDDVVSYANLPDFDGNVLLEKLDSTGSHVEAAATCLLQYVLFLLSGDFLEFEVADKTMDPNCADIMSDSSSTNAPSFADTFVPTMTPAPTTSPSPTIPPTKEETCGKILASWDAVEARNIVSKVYSDMFGQDSNEYALFELYADQSLQYGVQIRKVCASCSDVAAPSASYDDYCGQGVYGSGSIHSGLLMLPMSSDGTALAEGTFPGVVYNHEPTVARAPSDAWSAEGDSMTSGTMFGVLPAAAGSIAIMADFLGYGESNADIFKAFFVKKAYQTSTVPLWLKTAAILKEETNCTALADAAMISGFYEGGYASVAVASALNELGVEIIRVYAGAVPGRLGSIHLPELVKSIDGNGTFPVSELFVLALFGSAYSATYPGLSNFEEGPYLLDATVRDEIVQLVREAASRSSVEGAVPVDDPLSILNEDVVAWARSAYLVNDTNPCGANNFTTEGFQLFCDALAENDLMGMLNNAAYPVTLCHGRDDKVVSPANLPNGTANANLLISLVDGDHAASYVTCTSQIITFLSSPIYMNHPIAPKHDESICTNVPSMSPASTPSPAASLDSDDSAASDRPIPILFTSILCGLFLAINL